MKKFLSLIILCSLATAPTLFIQAGCGCDDTTEVQPAKKRKKKKRTQAQPKDATVPSTKKSRKRKKSDTSEATKKSTQSGTVHTITSKEQLDKFMKSDKPVIIKFKADWCGACKAINAHYKELAIEFGNNLIFVEIDIDDAAGSAISQEHKVQALPTFHVHTNSKKAGELIGANTEALRDLVKKHA